MKYFETPEFKAARSEDARLYAALCETVDYRNLPPAGTEAYATYRRDVVEPAKAEWWEARKQLNALRAAGEAAEAVTA
ncbi:hypothetical protein [Arthrobacter sp. HY1533]|uniref:hypothetical protein n=1 Tax=Arthrobacter sp. HY1533 TaxID=2970919 RepID=UPI0022BA076E|nr:hypothetical protein [Arthrobacter sp. HY1533]